MLLNSVFKNLNRPKSREVFLEQFKAGSNFFGLAVFWTQRLLIKLSFLGGPKLW